MDIALALLTTWFLAMNWGWFTTYRKQGKAWHWTIFLGPVAYEKHLRTR